MPTVNLWQRMVVAALVQLRHESGLTQAEAAERVAWDHTALSKLENMNRKVNGGDVRTLCVDAYQVADNKRIDQLAAMARASRTKRPQHAGDLRIPPAVADLIEMENFADDLSIYDPALIPGQLQTREYASAVIAPVVPTETAEDVEQRVDIRLARQEKLREREAKLWAVLDETALLRSVGGPEVMAAQLDYLADLAARPGSRITVQIVPMGLAEHPTLGNGFDLLGLDIGISCVYIDNLAGGSWVDDAQTLSVYREGWRRVSAVALDFAASITLLRAAAHRHRTGP